MAEIDINCGLTSEQAEQRVREGKSNGDMNVRTKSVKQIFADNIFTFFNMINAALAVLVLIFGSVRNALFMGVIISNIAIGIFQEIRSKRVIDRLSLISAPKARLLRDGREVTLPVSDICIDDFMLLSSGNQICADAVVVEGECEVNESLITGESDAVHKKTGDELISGSFLVSGSVKAQAVRVGAESTSGKITGSAKYIKKQSSEMMKSINTIIKAISFCIIPFGIVLFLKALFVTGQSVSEGVTTSVAALIAMIPEGLVLLTSVALAVSSIRLASKKTLCQDLYCVEALARTDVLCLDKTGTITEGTMELSEVVPLDKAYDCDKALNAFAGAFKDPNPTLAAIMERYTEKPDIALKRTIAFSSARKWSAAEFEGLGTVAVGAPSFVLGDRFAEISPECEKYTENGFRTLVLAHSDKPLGENALPDDVSPKALIIISDKIRSSAPAVFEYFKKQGVTLKVISGDDPVTVSGIAVRAGLENAREHVDMSKVTDDELPEMVEKCTVFGRVTPDRKLAIIKALKANGHKTAMTGDGVNDVPALKEADCSVTFQAASDAARSAAQIVLMNNDFACMPLVVEEGRRCINNIQRSAALFLVKTIFAFITAAAFLLLPDAYPFQPIQMTLVSALTIGAPSFLLALEPNFNRVRGSFIKNVLSKAAPGGISAALGIGLLMASQALFDFSAGEALSVVCPDCGRELSQVVTEIPSGEVFDCPFCAAEIASSVFDPITAEISTMATFLLGAACFGALFAVCFPFNKRRAAMFAVMAGAFCTVPFIPWLRKLFYIMPLNGREWLILGILTAVVWLARFLLGKLTRTKQD